MRFGDGLATGADLVDAAGRAAVRASRALAGQAPDLCAVFVCGGEPAAAGAALERAAELTGAGATIGGTASGVIAEGRGVEAAAAVAVWCAVLPGVRIRTFQLEVMPAESGMAVLGLPEPSADDAAALLLADPWSFPVDGFVEQSNQAMPRLPLVGGLAAGPTGRGSTRLLLDGHVVGRGAVGAFLSGRLDARAVVSQGCRPVGPAMTVTAAEGNLLLELAGAPALLKLREVLGSLPPEEQALVSGGLQLGLARDEYVDDPGAGDYLIRGIAGTQQQRNGLVVGDLVTVGSTVRFQVRDAATAHTDLVATLGRLGAEIAPAVVDGALLFSCNGRGSTLFGSADHDPLTLRERLSAGGVAGCFAAGEIGPVSGRNYVHGLSASLLAFAPGLRASPDRR